MLFWIIVICMTIVALAVVLAPLLRPRRNRRSAEPAAQDIAVYKDQLDEIARDEKRGVIETAEAEAARTEISRRLLAAADRTEMDVSDAPKRRRAVGVLVLIVIPAIALGTYVMLGKPGVPDQPLAARLRESPASQDIQTLIARVEGHLSSNPEDGQGWEVLAPIYMRLQRYSSAITAYRNSIRINGETPARLADLGEAIVAREGGIVSTEANDVFARAVKIDPKSIKARFFLATGLGQDGKKEEAIAAWNALIADGAGNEPWLRTARAQVAQLSGQGPAGPSADDVAAAGDMSAKDRQAMIEGMVSQLADRLKDEPDDLQGWLRLVQSYSVLGRADDARDALKAARDTFKDQPEAMAQFDALQKRLNL